MLTDRYGLELSAASAQARDAYVQACDSLLAAELGTESHFERALQIDPGFALAMAGLARAHLIVARVPQARAMAAAARVAAEHATERERSHVDALCLSIEGRPIEALAATRAHLARWPRDVMVLAPATSVFGLIGFGGRLAREPEQLAFLDTFEPVLGGDWWFDCVHAFALEECGRIEEARTLIERGMAANPRNAHGAHIKAHVLYEAGEDAAAIEYLETWMSGYPRQGMMHCHLSWHVALCSLGLGKLDKAWQIYGTQVQPGASWGPPINTMTDSVAFLWRAELAGSARRGELWQRVRTYADESFPSPGLAFVDAHAAVALAATSGDVAGLVAALRQRDAQGKAPAGSVTWQLAEGFAAYEGGDWPGAIRALAAALPETVRIGGSRAQRDLVEYTLLAACLKADRAADASALIARRENRRPSIPVAGWTNHR